MTTDDNNPLPPEPPEPLEPVPQSIEPVALEGAPAASRFSAPMERPLPEDLRVPWDWLDVALLAVIAFVGALLSGVVVAIVLGFFGVSPAHLRKSPDALGIIAVSAQILLNVGLLAYLAAQMRLRFQSPFWRTIGWRPLETGRVRRGVVYVALIFCGFFLARMVSLAESMFPPKHPLPIQTMLQTQHAALLFMLTAVLLAPVVEETVFRGYLYPVVARSVGVSAGVVITGTLFGLLHAGQLWGGWWQIALLVVVGILFTLVRAVSRTVVASYILHASYNALPVIAGLLSSVKILHIH
ncbi:MAG: type II CAAX endopeptidase family protein [Candidatus Acidiferrales bacterium]|jgi:membrane protease YdiL (CAAX protease family)